MRKLSFIRDAPQRHLCGEDDIQIEDRADVVVVVVVEEMRVGQHLLQDSLISLPTALLLVYLNPLDDSVHENG